MGSTQDPRAYTGRGDLDLRGGQACLDGCSSQFPQRPKLVGGEGVAMAALPLACHSTMEPCFYGVLGFSHKLSQL